MVTSFQSCSYQQKNNNNDIDSVSQSDSINSKDYYPEKIWKSDSLGCMGKRNISLARSIIEQHSLLGKTKNQFCSLFGNPNEIIKSENQIDLIYYIETMCNNNIGKGRGHLWSNLKVRRIQ
jgi:hypothetical protein